MLSYKVNMEHPYLSLSKILTPVSLIKRLLSVLAPFYLHPYVLYSADLTQLFGRILQQPFLFDQNFGADAHMLYARPKIGVNFADVNNSYGFTSYMLLLHSLLLRLTIIHIHSSSDLVFTSRKSTWQERIHDPYVGNCITKSIGVVHCEQRLLQCEIPTHRWGCKYTHWKLMWYGSDCLWKCYKGRRKRKSFSD